MKKALPIQSEAGEHFGFILFSGSPHCGDCIFKLLPWKPEVFDEPAFQFLEAYGFRVAGEHRWEINGDTISLSLSTGSTATIDLTGKNLFFDTGVEYKVGWKETEPDGEPERK